MYSYRNFSPNKYFQLGELENGDANWIINDKILAMSTPSRYRGASLDPKGYLPLFKKYNIYTVIRLNEQMYDSRDFEDEGI